MSSPDSERAGGRAWLARNGAGLLVALGAAAATAHGLYEVAHASKVPAGIAWLYPLITDGLGAVAYSATARLAGKAAGYAWACVVLAAGLSGLAQAIYLAADSVIADPVLRFGVGAWPAIACALVAHLLHLTLTSTSGHDVAEEPPVGGPVVDGPVGPVQAVAVRADTPADRARAALDGPADERDGTEHGHVGQIGQVGGADTDDHTDDHTDPDGMPVGRRDGQDDAADALPGEAGEGALDGAGGDGRVRLLRELLAAGAEVTGPQAAALLSHQARTAVSDRTARRLLAAAREPAGSTTQGQQPVEQPDRRVRLVLLPTGTTTTPITSTTSSTDSPASSDTDGGER